jgi:hypothetical protein
MRRLLLEVRVRRKGRLFGLVKSWRGRADGFVRHEAGGSVKHEVGVKTCAADGCELRLIGK